MIPSSIRDLTVFSSPLAYRDPRPPSDSCVIAPDGWRDTPASGWLTDLLESRNLAPAQLPPDIWYAAQTTIHGVFGFDPEGNVPVGVREGIALELDFLIASIWRSRMLMAAGWTEDQPVPPWAQMTTLVIERMLAPDFRPLDLWNVLKRTGSNGKRLWHQPFGSYHNDVRDVLVPGFDYHAEGDWLRLQTADGDDDCDVSQSDGTCLTVWRGPLQTQLPETVLQGVTGQPLGRLIGLGPLLAPWFADFPIKCAKQTDWHLELWLDVPVRTLAPAPRAALEAVGLADHPQAHEPWPWWLLPQAC